MKVKSGKKIIQLLTNFQWSIHSKPSINFHSWKNISFIYSIFFKKFTFKSHFKNAIIIYYENAQKYSEQYLILWLLKNFDTFIAIVEFINLIFIKYDVLIRISCRFTSEWLLMHPKKNLTWVYWFDLLTCRLKSISKNFDEKDLEIWICALGNLS